MRADDRWRIGTRVATKREVRRIMADHGGEALPFEHDFPNQGRFLILSARRYQPMPVLALIQEMEAKAEAMRKSPLEQAIDAATRAAAREAGVDPDDPGDLYDDHDRPIDEVYLLTVKPKDGPEGRW